MVGNPANTNCLIAMNNAPDIPRERFTSMMRLDHNRAIAQLATKLARAGHRRLADGRVGQPLADACTPTCSTPRCAASRPRRSVDDQAWIENDFLPNVGKRGAAIIEARGASSAASAANAAIDHVHDWVAGTDGGWVSMGVPSDGSYGIPEGLICGFPCTCADGEWSIVQGLELDEFSRARIDASVPELVRRARRGLRSGPDLTALAGPERVRIRTRYDRQRAARSSGRTRWRKGRGISRALS